MNLLGAMHADSSTDVTSEFIGATPMPSPSEEPVFEPVLLKEIALEKITAITSDPTPTRKGVERLVGPPCKWIQGRHLGHRNVSQHPEARKGLLVWTGLNGDELKPAHGVARELKGGCDLCRCSLIQITDQPAVVLTGFEQQLTTFDRHLNRFKAAKPAGDSKRTGGAEQPQAWNRHVVWDAIWQWHQAAKAHGPLMGFPE